MFYSKLLIACTVFLLGCSSTNIIRYTQSDYDILNKELSGEEVRIKVKNKMIAARNVRIYRDSLYFIESDSLYFIQSNSATQMIKPISAIKQITITDNSRGAWDGFGIGALIGLPISVGYVISESSGELELRLATLAVTVLTFGCGFVYGAPIGALVGHDATYVFETKADTTGLTQIDLE